MADITMCRDEECKLKEECYRYKAKPNEYGQSYFTKSPKVKKMGGYDCEYFWRMRDG